MEETSSDPWIAYKLGELYASAGKLEEARYWLKTATNRKRTNFNH